MSYYEMTDADYQPPQAGTPGWELAPVPGWGVNPLRAGPPVIATNGVPIRSIVADWTPMSPMQPSPMGASDSEEQGQQGAVALGVAGGIFFGWTLAWIYWSTKKPRKRA